MHDDYLWDETGDLDVEGAQMLALQRTLAPLRYEPEPLRLRHQVAPHRPSASLPWLVPALAAAAAATLVLALRASSPGTPDASVMVVSAQEPDPNPTGPQAGLAQVSGAQASAEPGNARPPKPPSAAGAPPAKAAKLSSTTPKPARVGKPRRPAKPPRRRARSKPVRPETKPPSVECILDPTRCGDDSPEKPSPGAGDKTPTVDCVLDPRLCEPLPETLSSSDIRAAMTPVKSQVQACGPKHGAAAGDRVKVKLSILGATGRVSKANAIGELASTSLGRCVAKAASKARFPRFKRERLAAIYPFTMPAPKAAPEPSKSATGLMREVSERANVKARACALAHDVPSGTRVDLEVKVSAAGKVTKVRVQPRDPLSSDATRCLKAAVGKIVVSPSATGVGGRIPLSL